MSDPVAKPSGKRGSRKSAAMMPGLPGGAPLGDMSSADAPSVDVQPLAEASADAVVQSTEIAADVVEQATARIQDVAEAMTDHVVEAAPALVPPAPAPQPAFAEMIEAAMSPAVDSDAVPAVPEMPAPIQEGLTTMATVMTPGDTTAFAQEKLQSAFGDVGARFKTGLEKSTKMGEELVELTKGNVEAVVASARVAAKGSESLGQDAAEYTKKSFESAVAAMKSMASVKSPTELFQLQSDFMKSSFDSAVAEASRFSESMMKLAGDVAQPLSSRYVVAAEKIKSAAL